MTTDTYYDGTRQGLWFTFDVGQEQLIAFISDEALRVHFKWSRESGSQHIAYKENQKIIEEVARRRLLDGCTRPIKLGVVDFDAVDCAPYAHQLQ
jgi:hypothetical protein